MIKNYNFVLDVDGVLTNGKFLYSQDGKLMKEFGAHDAYSLKKISSSLNVQFISADKRGFIISEKRITDMGFKLTLVSEDERFSYIKETFSLENLIFMGDGDADARLIKAAYIGIAPNNARPTAKSSADYITTTCGGEGAVAEACDYLETKLSI
jgi:3-deoxy-D-manno-octulosonate 8-phosphate phosphatase (KDO 8-P phosphatase)